MKKQSVIGIVIGVVLILGLSSFAIAKTIKSNKKKGEEPPPNPNIKDDVDSDKKVKTKEKKKAIVIVEPLETTDDKGNVISKSTFRNVKVLSDGTRVRQKPTTTSTIIKTFSKGTELKVNGLAQGLDSDGKSWYQVSTLYGTPISGFVRSDIVKEV